MSSLSTWRAEVGRVWPISGWAKKGGVAGAGWAGAFADRRPAKVHRLGIARAGLALFALLTGVGMA